MLKEQGDGRVGKPGRDPSTSMVLWCGRHVNLIFRDEMIKVG